MQISQRADRIHTALLLGWAVALVAFGVWLQWFWAAHSMDVDVYWEAGRRMLHGGAKLYHSAEDPANKVGYFIYPPLFAVLFAPITLLPRWAGYALWGAIELLAVWLAFRATRAACDVLGGRKGRLFYLLLTLGLIGALWTNLQEGQVNTLVVSTLAAGLWQLERKHEARGGLLLAAATHLKVIPIVILPLLLAQKRFKAAGMMAGGIVLLWFAPLVYSVPNYGPVEAFRSNVQLSVDYVEKIASPRVSEQQAFSLGGVRAPNNAVSAVAQRWFGKDERVSLHTDRKSPLAFTLPDVPVRWAGLALGAVLGALAMLLAWRRRDDPQARIAVMGLGVVSAALANLLFWPHHLCLLLLVLGPLAARAMQRRRLRPVVAAVGIVLVLCYIPLLDKLPFFDWMAVLGMPTLGVLILWACTWLYFLERPTIPKP